MRTRSLAAALLAVAAITGCGGGSTAEPAAHSSKTAQPTTKLDTPEAVAIRIGCTGYTVDQDTELFARQNATCTLAGATVYIATFTSSSNRDSWTKIAQAMGSRIVVGGLFTVWSEDDSQVKTLAASTGGSVH